MPPALKPEDSDYSDYFSDAMSIDEEPEDVVASLETEFSREQARLALLEQKIEIAKVDSTLKERRESAGSIDEHTLAAKEVNGLSYYVLPRLPDGYTGLDWLSIELGIFAGRLYINFPVCAPLTNYIQLADKTGTNSPQSRTKHVGISTKNPADFLLE